jgi:hypothetical protein
MDSWSYLRFIDENHSAASVLWCCCRFVRRSCGRQVAGLHGGALGELGATQRRRLRGKVVLVDVWEYTCINWLRTLPDVQAWNREYASLGLVVVGVHSPEFEFGKRAENFDRGIRDHGLTYPIAITRSRNVDEGARSSVYIPGSCAATCEAQTRIVER